ncbi:MAG: chalcone isomerase family protein [Aquabacterium sp.]|jgi:hypothetical protein|uniref:chalcone isomerase family protein n=1 Tax=Aquabacterium sp. TaxID=1872578 RepID=UPI001B5EB531|nr:chalcone isomerase family protein [Aquabacterium sp.]MBP7133031.1 chalcone isomerase family protein [Aquabacterium sp.]MDQ5927226.1 hypothetical protein [Pseudomonadota bacterium]
MSLLPFMDSRLGRATMRAFLGACVTMALLNTPAVQAQSADAVGVIYAPTLDVEGRALTLNGTGVAYRALVKLYTVGLYLPTKVHKTSEVLAQTGPKQLRFVLLRSMRVDELGKLITNGIEHNCNRQEFFRLIPAIRSMGAQFSRMQRLGAQDVFTIAYMPERGTVFLVNDEPVGAAIADPLFFPAILKVWLGDQPTTTDLKNALLEQKAQPVLSALE